MSNLVKVIIAIVIVCSCAACTGCSSTDAGTGTGGVDTIVTDEVDYDDEVTDDGDGYEEEMPEKIFEPSDLVGKWVNETDPTYPDILEISKSGDTYYYNYYGIAPGDVSGIGYGVQSTEWEYCSSTILMNPYRGNFECDNSDRTDTYEMFFYIDENTIERVDDGEYFYRNDDFEYVNPYADTDNNMSYLGSTCDDEEDFTSEEYTVIYGIENLLKLSYFTADELFEISGLEEDYYTNFYSYYGHEVFDNTGTLAFKTDESEVSDIRWYGYYSEEEGLDLYDIIINMLEEVYEVTDGYECEISDECVMYCCEYDGKEVCVEKYEDCGELEISFVVREYVE